METKCISYDIKDLDDKKGIVQAYANAYGNEDSDGDISAKGSFNRTVKNNFKRIRVLKDHITTITLGVPLEIDTKDSFGLLTTTQFNLKKEVARDMFTDIELMKNNGLNAELSIGYNVIKRDDTNTKIITEYKLLEYSFLTSWAANKLATVQDVKSLESHYGFMELLQKSYNLNYSDTRLIQIEKLLKALDNKDSLDSSTPDVNPLINTLTNFTLN